MPVSGHRGEQEIAQESAEYWHGVAIAQEAEIERLRAALESVCNVGDRAAVMVAEEALRHAG